MSTFIILLSILVLILKTLYFLNRNNKVYELRTKISELCLEYNCSKGINSFNFSEESAYMWYYDKLPSYSQMIWSYKPLTIEKWSTEEQLIKIKYK